MTKTLRKKVYAALPKNVFVRGVGVMVGGTIGSQLLVIAAAPILTRIYTPEQFGMLAVFFAIAYLFTVIASLRYEMAILLPEDDDEASNLMALSLLVVLVTSLVLALLVWSFGDTAMTSLNVPQLARFLWILPVAIALIGFFQVLSNWALRHKRFNVIASTNLKQSAAMLAAQILGHPMGAVALIGGQVIGHAAGGLSLAFAASRDGVQRSITWKKIVNSARRYRRFPIFDLWYAIFNTMSVQAVPILFAAFFGPAAAGLYLLAQRVLNVPARIVGNSIAKAFFPSAVDGNRKGGLGKLVSELHLNLGLIAMPPVLLLMVMAPDMFALIFGESWRSAGELARWLSPLVFAIFVSSPMSTIFIVLERQVEGAIYQGITLLGRVAALYAGAAIGSVLAAAGLYASVSVILVYCFLGWTYKQCEIPLSELLRSALLAAGAGLAIASPVILAYSLTEDMAVRAASFLGACLLLGYHYARLYRKML